MWRQVVVTIGAILGSLCLAVAILGMFFGIKPLVFTSGSMEPQISTGALAFAQQTPAADLRTGDVVSVLDAQGVRVTHRVVSATPAFGSTSLVLKGDANDSADVDPYSVTTGDRVLVDVPYGGYAVEWLSSDEGLLVGGLFVGLVLIAAFSPSQGPRHLRASRRRAAVHAFVAIGVLGASTQASIELAPTQAFWTDSAGATSGTFSTLALANVPTPASSSCAENGSNVTGSWASVGPRFQYQVTANRTDIGTAQVGSPQYFTSTSATLNPTSFAPATTFQGTGKFNFNFRVKSAALNTTTWLSPSTTDIPFHFNQDYTNIDCGNDTATSVAISAITSDSGSSGSDFVTNVASTTLSGTSTPGDASTIVVKRNGTTVATVSANVTTGAWSAPITLTEGAATYTAESTDYIGNTATATQTLRLDTVAPTAAQSTSCSSTGNAVAGVAGATWCKVTSLPLTATSTDTGGSGVVSQEINNDGSGFAAYSAPVGLAEDNGRVVQIRATDLAGNISTVDSKTYYIDGTAPTLTFTAPLNNTDYGSSANLRTAATNGCAASRVACGGLVDAVSGRSATAPRWNLRRQAAGTTTSCLNTSSYSTTCTSTYAVTLLAGNTFRITSGTANTATIYADKGANDQIYTLTISQVADRAGNSTTVTSTYND